MAGNVRLRATPLLGWSPSAVLLFVVPRYPAAAGGRRWILSGPRKSAARPREICVGGSWPTREANVSRRRERPDVEQRGLCWRGRGGAEGCRPQRHHQTRQQYCGQGGQGEVPLRVRMCCVADRAHLVLPCPMRVVSSISTVTVLIYMARGSAERASRRTGSASHPASHAWSPANHVRTVTIRS
jgi:hypothetical protein